MKNLILTLLVVYIVSTTHGQNVYVGTYVEHYGNNIQLFSDSTFKFSGGYPKYYWANGKWRVSNDTLYFSFVPVYDTISYYDTLRFTDNSKRVKIYSLVFSCDDQSTLITENQEMTETPFSFQESRIVPKKLFYKKDVLYDFDLEGKIIKKNYRNEYSRKKFSSGYYKVGK